jgi:hypothetical protein
MRRVKLLIWIMPIQGEPVVMFDRLVAVNPMSNDGKQQAVEPSNRPCPFSMSATMEREGYHRQRQETMRFTAIAMPADPSPLTLRGAVERELCRRC